MDPFVSGAVAAVEKYLRQLYPFILLQYYCISFDTVTQDVVSERDFSYWSLLLLLLLLHHILPRSPHFLLPISPRSDFSLNSPTAAPEH